VPRLEFVKIQPQPEPPRPLDYGAIGFFDVFTVVDMPWSHSGPSSLQPTPCASNFRPTVVGGSTQQAGVIDGPFTHLVVLWPVGGPVFEVDSSWGAVKALYEH
jgi:hypothetical protein